MPKDLSDDATRDDKVLALANQLHERGITASLADARRLAEGMVDTEARVIGQTRGERGDSLEDIRRAAQRDPLFDAVLGKGGSFMLRLPDDFRDFVDRSQRIPVHKRPDGIVYQNLKVVPKAKEEHAITFAEAPDIRELMKEKEATRVETTVEKTDDSFVVSRKQERQNEMITEEVGVVEAETRPAPKQDVPEVDLGSIFYSGSEQKSEPQERPTKPEPREIPKASSDGKKDLAKEQGIDLFDIFKTK